MPDPVDGLLMTLFSCPFRVSAPPLISGEIRIAGGIGDVMMFSTCHLQCHGTQHLGGY
jgi:hypothetical protein